MLELNCDIIDASKKLVVGSVSASKMKTEETARMWAHTLEDIRELMQHRAQLLIGHPLTKHEHLKTVRLPPAVEDEYGVPPVVVWFGSPPKEKAGGKDKGEGKSSAHQWDNHNVRQRWTGPTSS